MLKPQKAAVCMNFEVLDIIHRILFQIMFCSFFFSFLLDQKERKNQDNPPAGGLRYMPTLARLFVLQPALFEQTIFGF